MEHDAVRFVLEKTVFVYETQRNFRGFEDTAIVKIHITKFIKLPKMQVQSLQCGYNWCYLAWCLMGNMPSMNKMTM